MFNFNDFKLNFFNLKHKIEFFFKYFKKKVYKKISFNHILE